MSDIIAKLRSQIGDDVQQIYDHEALFRIAADRIEALEAERDTAIAAAYEAAADFLQSIDGYDAIDGEHPLVSMIRALPPADAIAERDADRARVRREALEEAAAWCHANTMDIAMDVNERVFAGLYCAGEFTADGGRHSGMGYAAAIRAMIEQEEGDE